MAADRKRASPETARRFRRTFVLTGRRRRAVLRLGQSTRTKDMARTAQEFLTSWRQSYVYAEARPPEALDEAVAECVADGLDEGHTRDALEKQRAVI